MPRAVPYRLRRFAPWALLAVLFFVMIMVSFSVMDQWISDSRFYLAWSYRYLGYSEADAARMTYEFMFHVDNLDRCDFCWPADYQYSFFHGENGAVVAPRMIYPLLSAPFVAVFGPKGMLVIPALAYAAGTTATAWLATRLWGRWWGVAAGAALLLSAISVKYATMAMTDSLALMFNVLGLLFLPLLRERKRWDVLWFLLILLLNLFTRQFAVTVAAGVALAWLIVAIRDRRVRNPWLPFAAGSILLTPAVVLLQNLYAARFFQGSELSLTDRYQKLAMERYGVDGLGSIPRVIGYQFREDYLYVRELDMPLVLLIGAAAVAMIWRYRSELSGLLAGMAVVTLAMGALIVDQTYFRYFVPLMPLMVLCLLALVRDLFRTRVRPSLSNEGTAPPTPGQAPTARWRWAAVIGVYLVMAFFVWRETLSGKGAVIVLTTLITGLAIVALALLTGRRFGQAAGAVTAIVFCLSPALLVHSLDTAGHSIALLAVVGSLAFLPGSGLEFSTRDRAGAFFALMLIAATQTPRVIPFAAGVVTVWLIAWARDRGLRNDWLPLGLISLAAIVYALIFGYNGTAQSASRTAFLLAKELTAERVLIAVAVIAAVALLGTVKKELSWLALAGTAAAGLFIFATGTEQDLAGGLQLIAPVFIMATAGAVTSYIGKDQAAAPDQLPLMAHPAS